jgi:hypothetical protein
VNVAPFGKLLLECLWHHDFGLIGALISPNDKVVFLISVSVDFLVVQFAGSATIH